MGKSISIVGGGISGIIAALELEKAGYAPTIYESTDRLGGRVKSDYIDNYPYDHGFQVLLTTYPEAKRYLDYDKLNLQYFLSGSRVVEQGKTVRIGDPLSSAIFWLDVFDPTLSTIGDKLKTLSLSLKLKKKADDQIFQEKESTTLDYLIEKGFSDRIIYKFFRPFFGGIFLETELRTSSRFFEFLFKMFANGHSVIPSDGMQKITDQLVAQLKNTDIKTNTKISSIESKLLTLDDGSTIATDKIIIATDAHQFNLSKKPVEWKRSINYYFQVDKAVYSDKLITLIADDDRLINNYYYPTNLIPHPENKTILSATVVNDKGLNDKQLLEQATQQLLSMSVATKNIKLITSYDIPHSLPEVKNISYTLSPDKIKIAPNIYNCGDHLSMGSLNAAMSTGRYVAEMIIKEN